MEILHAHKQWANRPADQQFETVGALYLAARKYADGAIEREGVNWNTLRVEALDGDVALYGKGNAPAMLTHWAFGQIAARAEAPADYLRRIPATLAAQNINHGLRKLRENESSADLLFHQNGSLVCRSITGEKYERIWNWEIAQRLMDMKGQGWNEARPTHGGNAALYASGHDMFAFMMQPNQYIQQPVRSARGESAPLYKGLIAGNSEVGGGSYWMMSFLYNYMCGNHIIWGASNVVEFRARHVGTIRDRVQGWSVKLQKYLDSSMNEDQAKIQRAANLRIAATKEELLDTVFGKRLQLSRKEIGSAYDACLPEEDGSPLTVWGFVQGATRYSQSLGYTDERTRVDRAAAKVMDLF